MFFLVFLLLFILTTRAISDMLFLLGRIHFPRNRWSEDEFCGSGNCRLDTGVGSNSIIKYDGSFSTSTTRTTTPGTSPRFQQAPKHRVAFVNFWNVSIYHNKRLGGWFHRGEHAAELLNNASAADFKTHSNRPAGGVVSTTSIEAITLPCNESRRYNYHRSFADSGRGEKKIDTFVHVKVACEGAFML